ncbi:unnamed protein product [Auanema sp. JU1783]|nr:unnamed protein product [Auanema sp. JU1783]
MCDSEDEEFLSASEGELSDNEDQKVPEDVKPVQEDTASATATADSDSLAESTDIELSATISSTSCAEDDCMKRSQSSEDSNIQIVDVPSSQSSVASLTEDKKILLNEIIKEAEDLEISRSSGSPQSDEDAELKSDTPVATFEDTKTPEPEVQVHEAEEEQQKKQTENAWQEDKKTEENVEEPNSSDWGDWGDEFDTSSDVKTKGVPNEAEWSLIDEKKLRAAQTSEEMNRVFDKLNEVTQKPNQGWGWGGIASAIGETFSSAVENTLGLPSAEELAKKAKEADDANVDKNKEEHAEESAQPTQNDLQNQGAGFGLFSGILSGGIDVLENIGKKTFEAVTVKDPAQGNRRLRFTENSDNSNLSDILKERRDNEEIANLISMGGVGSTTSASKDVVSLFKRNDGYLNYETLEMLSTKLQKPALALEGKFLAAMKAINTDDAFSGEFGIELRKIIQRIGLPYDPRGLVSTDESLTAALDFCDNKTSEELLGDCVKALVEFLNASIQVISKLAQLMLLPETSVNWTLFIDLFKLLAQRITYIGDRYVEVLNFYDDNADANSTLLNVEVSSAVELVQQAFQLLIPIFPS